MERIREYLLKKGWFRTTDIPSSIQGENTVTSATILNNRLDGFKSNNMKPVQGFEDTKDGNSEHIEGDMAMMSTEKRTPQPYKVPTDLPKLRESLLLNGWYGAPSRVVSKGKSTANGAADDKKHMDIRKPRFIDDDLNMAEVQKRQRAKYHGTVDKDQFVPRLLSICWYDMNSDSKNADTLAEVPQKIPMEPVNLERVIIARELEKDTHFNGLEYTPDDVTASKNQDLVAVEINITAENKNENISTKDIENGSLRIQGTDLKTRQFEEQMKKVEEANGTFTDVPEVIENSIRPSTKESVDLNSERKAKKNSARSREKKPKPHELTIHNLLQQGWTESYKSRHQITLVNDPECVSKDDLKEASKRSTLDKMGSGRTENGFASRKNRKDQAAKSKSVCLNKATPLKKKDKESPMVKDDNDEACVVVAVEINITAENLASTPKDKTIFTKDTDNGSFPIHDTDKLEETMKKVDVAKNWEIITNTKPCNATTKMDVVKNSAKSKEKDPKKPKPHELAIQNLLQQGWTESKKSRHQITLVKDPESVSKGGLKSVSKRQRMSTMGSGRKEKGFASNANEATPLKKRDEESPMVNDDQEEASGVSRKKRTLLIRLIRRSRKLMGRLFKCGKKEV